MAVVSNLTSLNVADSFPFTFLVTGAPTNCPEPYGVQAYAHPENCDQFFLCTNGTLTLETCENGLLFSGKGGVHNHCNYNWAVECGERKHDRKSTFQVVRSFTIIEQIPRSNRNLYTRL